MYVFLINHDVPCMDYHLQLSALLSFLPFRYRHRHDVHSGRHTGSKVSNRLSSCRRRLYRCITRVYALYEKSRAIGAILVTYLLAELSVALWIYCTPGGGRKL